MKRSLGQNTGRAPSFIGGLREVREKARKRGVSALQDAIEYAIKVLYDSSEPTANRLRAAVEIMDRFGLPRLQQTQEVGDAAAPKLFMIAAPPGAVAGEVKSMDEVTIDAPPDEPHENGANGNGHP